MQATTEKTHEVLFKPYSSEVLGYIARIFDCQHIILNCNIAKSEIDKAYSKLLDLSTNYPQYPFILLKADGNVYKTEDLKLPEMSDK